MTDTRPARPEDHAAIAAFTKDTFAWGDYVSDSFDAWLTDEAGAVLVAVDTADQPLALARVVLASPREAWLQAARVHPEHRRRGLGGRLNDACVQWAAARGAVVARLLADEDNPAPHGQVAKLGYRPVARVVHAHLDQPRIGRSIEKLRPLDPSEAGPALAVWSAGELAATAHGLAARNWVWRQLHLQHLDEAARCGRLFGNRHGWVEGEFVNGQGAVWWLSCEEDSAPDLLESACSWAAASSSAMQVHIPATGWLMEPLTEAGFRVAPAVIYEKQTGTVTRP